MRKMWTIVLEKGSSLNFFTFFWKLQTGHFGNLNKHVLRQFSDRGHRYFSGKVGFSRIYLVSSKSEVFIFLNPKKQSISQ